MPKKKNLEDLRYYIDEGFLEIFSFYDEYTDLTHTQAVGVYDFKPVLITKKGLDYLKINKKLYRINDSFIVNYTTPCGSLQEITDSIDRWVLNFVRTKVILNSNNKPKTKTKKKNK